MIITSFKKSIFISFLGHLTVFGLFSFSFGAKLPDLGLKGVYFLGDILTKSDFMRKTALVSEKILLKKSTTLTLDKVRADSDLASPGYLKPNISLPFREEKLTPIYKIKETGPVPKRKESVIMFYPQLPSHFMLYFKDRALVHIELMFNISSEDARSSLEIKRKISSGNLEADLLTMRYISHYLFMQQKQFKPDTWQTIKIDLSTKND